MTLNDFLSDYAGPITQGMFMFAFGACVGSLTNVLVYRLPRGLDVIAPPSACPACGTRLTWRENIPVLGWLALGGKCRFCKSPISPEYPLVEAFVGLLFVALYILFYLLSPGGAYEWLGVDWGLIRPEWTAHQWGRTWPAFIVLLVLVSSLVASTLVDFKTFTIPHQLTTVPAIVGIVAHPLHAAWIQNTRIPTLSIPGSPDVWAMATFGYDGWRALGAGVGGMLGLGLSLLLVRLGLLKRSFADYDEWEAAERAKVAGTPEAGAALESTDSGDHDPVAASQRETDSDDASDSSGEAPPPPPAGVDDDLPVGERHRLTPKAREAVLVYAAAFGVCATIGLLTAQMLDAIPFVGLVIGVLVGPIVGAIVLSVRQPVAREAEADAAEEPAAGASDPGDVIGDPEMWLAYPHARREMIREILFIGPIICLALAGAAVAGWLGGPWTFNSATGASEAATKLPLWAVALGGTLMGYLIGGGVVWAVRILGSLAFGKEAMGMGDVHLMAAVGACVGWIDATLGFFLAAFVGIYWVILAAARTRGQVSRAMPYGPYLAAATLLVILAKPAIELGLGRLTGGAPVNLP
ncbi:MAG: A24 family peptidase [Phycisphaerales bacterium]